MTRARKHFGETNVIVDMFGPLVDVGKIHQFADVDARYASEEEIARRKGGDWTAEKVLDAVESCLKDKGFTRIVQQDLVELLCQAKQYTNLTIVSSVPREAIFTATKQSLIAYAKREHSATLDDSNFSYQPRSEDSEGGIVAYLKGMKDENRYTIVVDDNWPSDADIDDKYDMWLAGENEATELVGRLTSVLEDRFRISKAIELVQGMEDTLQISGMNAVANSTPGFVVYDKAIRASLSNQADKIKQILAAEPEGKPICVFLSGPPGSGKSHFVDMCAQLLNADTSYPMTSLSGVASSKFSTSIENHVQAVFDDGNKKRAVAFLDEVDTVTSSGETAFRFLMNPMTGTRTDDDGRAIKDKRSGSVRGLVWFFAGSAGLGREEFLANLEKHDRKVHDFFDRIHFYIELPGARDVGQSVIQALTSIGEYAKKHEIEKVERNLLLAFAATEWPSVRAIKTVCRLALSTKAQQRSFVGLKDFEGIEAPGGFKEISKLVRERKLYLADDLIGIKDWVQ